MLPTFEIVAPFNKVFLARAAGKIKVCVVDTAEAIKCRNIFAKFGPDLRPTLKPAAPPRELVISFPKCNRKTLDLAVNIFLHSYKRSVIYSKSLFIAANDSDTRAIIHKLNYAWSYSTIYLQAYFITFNDNLRLDTHLIIIILDY